VVFYEVRKKAFLEFCLGFHGLVDFWLRFHKIDQCMACGAKTRQTAKKRNGGWHLESDQREAFF
jgi:hypothetical protein